MTPVEPLDSESSAILARDKRRRSSLEIAAVVATGGAFLIFENVLHLKLPFLIGCTVLWTIYLVRRIAADRTVLADWGLRRDTLKPATLACGAFFLVAGCVIALFRWWKGWAPLPLSALLLVALYPVWGFIQQFVLQGLLVSNLRKLGAKAWLVIPIASVLFGVVHLPDHELAVLCAAAGIAWTCIFLWRPNLLPLALTHGWLGVLAYYWVLGRDPWQEMFGHG